MDDFTLSEDKLPFFRRDTLAATSLARAEHSALTIRARNDPVLCGSFHSFSDSTTLALPR